jgi:transposase
MSEIALSDEDRKLLKQFVKKGTKKARAIARAKVLLFIDDGYNNTEISKMTDVHRQGIWRIKKRFSEEGLEFILEEKPRSGQPKKYTKKQEADIIAMACTKPPIGRERWSVRLLTERMKRRKDFKSLNRETVRIILKKAKQNHG